MQLCKVSLEPGRVMISEEWIYFEDYQKLCKVRIDGSDYTVISEKGSWVSLRMVGFTSYRFSIQKLELMMILRSAV